MNIFLSLSPGPSFSFLSLKDGIISISVMMETSGLMGKCDDGSFPIEAHGEGREGFCKDGGEQPL